MAKFEFIQYNGNNYLEVNSTSYNLTFKALDFREAYKIVIPVSHYGITEVRIGPSNQAVLPATETISFGSKTFKNFIVGNNSSGTVGNLIFYGSQKYSLWIKTKRISYNYKNQTNFYHYLPPHKFFKDYGSEYLYTGYMYMVDGYLWIRVIHDRNYNWFENNGKTLSPCNLTISSPKSTAVYSLNEPVTLYVNGLNFSYWDYDEEQNPMYGGVKLDAVVSFENYGKDIINQYGSLVSDVYLPKWRFYYRTNFDEKSYVQKNNTKYENFKWLLADEGYFNNYQTSWSDPVTYFRNETSKQGFFPSGDTKYHLPESTYSLTNDFTWTADRTSHIENVIDIEIIFAFATSLNSFVSSRWPDGGDIAIHGTSSEKQDYIFAGPKIDILTGSDTVSLEGNSAFFGYGESNSIHSDGRYWYQGIKNTHYYRDGFLEDRLGSEILHFKLRKFK